jgi:hypothetical protein
VKVLAAAYFVLLGYLFRATGTDSKLYRAALEFWESHVEYVADIHAKAITREHFLLVDAMLKADLASEPDDTG